MNKKKTAKVAKRAKPAGESKVNKSEEIREIYRKKPDSKPSEIVSALAKRGIEVSPQQVSTTRMNAIKNGLIPASGSTVKVVKSTKPAKRGRPVGSTNAARAAGRPVGRPSGNADAVSVDALLETKKLIEHVGLDNVKSAVNALEQIL